MFNQLFERPHALARQLSAPLVEERRQYLSLCHAQEFSRSSLRLTAQLLVATAEYLKLGDRPSAIITLQEVEDAGSRWSQRVSLPPIENPRLSCQRFVHTASGWLTFLCRLEIPPTPAKPYDHLVEDFAEFLRKERGLSSTTIDVLSLCGPFWIGSVWANVHSTPSPSLMSIPLWRSRSTKNTTLASPYKRTLRRCAHSSAMPRCDSGAASALQRRSWPRVYSSTNLCLLDRLGKMFEKPLMPLLEISRPRYVIAPF